MFLKSIEMCLDIYQVDHTKCIPGLAWQAAQKKRLK